METVLRKVHMYVCRYMPVPYLLLCKCVCLLCLYFPAQFEASACQTDPQAVKTAFQGVSSHPQSPHLSYYWIHCMVSVLSGMLKRL